MNHSETPVHQDYKKRLLVQGFFFEKIFIFPPYLSVETYSAHLHGEIIAHPCYKHHFRGLEDNMQSMDPEPAGHLPKVPANLETNLRVVLLLTSPSNGSMNGVLARLGAKIKRKTATGVLYSHLGVSENLCFAKHMAIGIVPLNIRADKSLQY
jgi:hypothetical protein